MLWVAFVEATGVRGEFGDVTVGEDHAVEGVGVWVCGGVEVCAKVDVLTMGGSFLFPLPNHPTCQKEPKGWAEYLTRLRIGDHVVIVSALRVVQVRNWGFPPKQVWASG